MEARAVLCYDHPSWLGDAFRRAAKSDKMQPTTNAGPRPPTQQPNEVELSVIVPTRNEAENVAPLLDRLGAALAGRSFEILFVDDSSDVTAGVIGREAAGRSFRVSLIARPEERRNGLSGAVVEGMAAAGGRWLGVIDADLQHPPELIPQLLEQAHRTGADVVVASRQADLFGPVGLSRARAMTSQLLTILARMVFPRVLKNVSDPLTGFFLVRQAAIDTTVLQPEGFKILLEILVRHPDLRVGELSFDFAPRHEGQSKADLHEGIRFFRHLSRLRLTINQHLIRFLILVCLAVVLNLALLGGAAAGGWPVMRAAAVAGGATMAVVLLGEAWIFSDRPRGPARRRLAAVLLLGALFLLAVYMPAIWLIAVRLGGPVWLAGLAAMMLAGFVYYLFSEQWIWTRGLMMRPRANVYYDIHGLLTIASQIPLFDLDYFRAAARPDKIDLQLRVDRHGTPSRISGAICYDEHLGRFGFGLTVVPGDFTEIVVSPLLETSAAFLYTNVVEPVLGWMLATRGYALARAGAVQSATPSLYNAPMALLIVGQPNLGYPMSRICADGRLSFMGDDRVIIGRDRLVRSFPKPVTVGREMLTGQLRTRRADVAVRFQRLLYSRPVRRLGLFLSRRRLPAATVNTYLQRLVPQPKYPLDSLVGGVTYGREAAAVTLVWPDRGDGRLSQWSLEAAIDSLLEMSDRGFGFHPYPLLVEELGRWAGHDWREEERRILRAGLAGCRLLHWRYSGERWWEQVTGVINARIDSSPITYTIAPIKSA
jgi:glycosyltransferase involved in cell wall biosynthesis